MEGFAHGADVLLVLGGKGWACGNSTCVLIDSVMAALFDSPLQALAFKACKVGVVLGLWGVGLSIGMDGPMLLISKAKVCTDFCVCLHLHCPQSPLSPLQCGDYTPNNTMPATPYTNGELLTRIRDTINGRLHRAGPAGRVWLQ